ncbi:Chromosome stability protein 9 [Nakaseomyces glabratus]|nr:Chromosome stability protein 9 [Nakaseomyces glabratus]KTB22166.1 Chromosome stability protein 9 [Nakaseomyces glabratus]
MPENQFSQPFVHCGVCHRRHSVEDPLWLTSCAHLLCQAHLTPTKVCGVCGTRDISCLRLTNDKPLPNEVDAYFQPISGLVENMYNVCQFQYVGLLDQCNYYQKISITLKEKCNRQQQLLYKAKQELDNIPRLKRRIDELESLLKEGNYGIKKSKDNWTHTKRSLPQTVDLTIENTDQEEDQNFIQKLKNNTGLRKITPKVAPNNISAESSSHKMSITPGIFAMAESTQLISNQTTTSSVNNNQLKFKTNIHRSPSSNIMTKDSQPSNQIMPQVLNKLTMLKRNNTVSTPNLEKSNTQMATHRSYLGTYNHPNSTMLLNRRRANSQQQPKSSKQSNFEMLRRVPSSNKNGR